MGNLINYRKKPVQYKRIGDKYYKENDFQQALFWYTEGLRNRPGNIKLLVCKANTLFQLYYYHEAMENYLHALKRSKKLIVIRRFINKYHRNINDSVEKLALRLGKRHGLNIEPNAIYMLIDYIQTTDANQSFYNERLNFFNHFNKNTLHSINDYIDEYLWKYGINYQYYLPWFYQLCQIKGFLLNQNELLHKIKEREIFWSSASQKDQQIFPIISAIERMSGEEFEKFIEKFFKKQGYKTVLTKKTGDWGGDLIVKGNRMSISIQCKRWKETVGIEAVQEAHTAKDVYKTHHAMVITNSSFSSEAKN